MLSVSAPVPAVVGIQINFGKGLSLLMCGEGCSSSKSQSGMSLLAVKQIAFPPSIALPPPIVIIESCFPERNLERPLAISSSRGFGEISKNRSDPMFASIKNFFSFSIKGNSLLPRSVTISGFLIFSDSQNLPILLSVPGPYEIGIGKVQSCGVKISELSISKFLIFLKSCLAFKFETYTIFLKYKK